MMDETSTQSDIRFTLAFPTPDDDGTISVDLGLATWSDDNVKTSPEQGDTCCDVLWNLD